VGILSDLFSDRCLCSTADYGGVEVNKLCCRYEEDWE